MKEDEIIIKLSIGGYYIFKIDYENLFNYVGKYYRNTGKDLIRDVEKLPSTIGKILEDLVDDRISKMAEVPYEDKAFEIYEDEFTKKYKDSKTVCFKASDSTYMKAFIKESEKKLLITSEEVASFRSFMIPKYNVANNSVACFLTNRLLVTMIKAREEYIQKCLPIINANISDLEKYLFEEIKKIYKEE